MLEIRKKGNKNFTHIAPGYSEYGANDIVIIFEGNITKLRSVNGRIILDRAGYRLNEVSVYDDTATGTQEQFATIAELKQRLINLGYPWYNESTVSGAGNFQEVTDNGNTTTNDIIVEGSGTFGDGSRAAVNFNDGAAGNISTDGTGANFNHNAGINLNAPRNTVKKGLLNYDISALAGDWDASTNVPTLSDADVNKQGLEYRVSVAGTVDFGAGPIDFGQDDIVGNNGSIWYKKVDNNQGGGIPTRTIETTLPSEGIIIDSTKIYHIDSGVIKPALSGHTEGADIEVICNPSDGSNLVIDLTDFPFIELQGGGFIESPANYYTLETNVENNLFRQHIIQMLFRRGYISISNSSGLVPSLDVNFASESNTTNDYVTVVFNKIVDASDLVIGNFSETFTQNGDTATGISLDSITDGDGNPISSDTDTVRFYYTITGSTNGLASFVINATSLTDIYGNTSTNVNSSPITLISSGIVGFSNVIEYWESNVGDNDSGTATKTGEKNGKVLSASGVGNPSLSGGLWSFDGVNDGLQISDSAINDEINPINKTAQIHYIGQYNNSASSRLVTMTVSDGSAGNRAAFIYKAGSGNAYFYMLGDTGSVSQDLGIALSLNTNYLFSVKFDRRDLGSGVVNVVDCYVDDGTTIQSYLDLDISAANGTLELDVLSIGMRDQASTNYYQVGWKALVFGDSIDNFDEIRNTLRSDI